MVSFYHRKCTSNATISNQVHSVLDPAVTFFAFISWISCQENSDSHVDGPWTPVRGGAGYIIFLLGLIIGLDTTGLNLRCVLVLGGALGVGIGFGLQNIVANFVAGIVILWEGPVKVGDIIDVGNTHGEVTRIGARGTWVLTYDNEVIIVPNSDFINSRVANWMANDRTVRMTIPLGVSYDSDLETVRGVLLDIAKRNERVMSDPAPAVLITGFGDNSVNISLRVSTTIMTDRAGSLKSDLFMEIFRVFRTKKIEMPFPQQDVRVRSIDAPIVIASSLGITTRPTSDEQP
jgi:small-conductance mechanosensitive channel